MENKYKLALAYKLGYEASKAPNSSIFDNPYEGNHNYTRWYLEWIEGYLEGQINDFFYNNKTKTLQQGKYHISWKDGGQSLEINEI